MKRRDDQRRKAAERGIVSHELRRALRGLEPYHEAARESVDVRPRRRRRHVKSFDA